MSTNLYVVDYIRRAIASDTIEAPDAKRAGRHIEVLESIYTGHKMGGANTAETAWQTVARMRPEVAGMFSVLKYVYNSLDLHKIPRLAYLLDEYPIYEASQNLLVGPRGTGKSFIAVDVACRVAQADKVLYIAGEGVPTYQSRVLAWHDYNQKSETGNLYFYGTAVSHLDNFEGFFEWVTGEIKPVLVVVDTVARCMSMAGANENDATEMGKFVAAWDKFKQRGTALLMIHHTNRSGTQRGSGVLDDAADSVLFLHKHEAGIAVRNDYMGGGKNKDRKEAKPLYFQIQTHEVGQFTGDEAAAVLVPAERKEIHMDEVGETLTENQMLIIDLLQDSGGMLPKEIQEALPTVPRSTAYRTVNAMVESELLTKSGSTITVTDKGKRIYESQ